MLTAYLEGTSIRAFGFRGVCTLQMRKTVRPDSNLLQQPLLTHSPKKGHDDFIRLS